MTLRIDRRQFVASVASSALVGGLPTPARAEEAAGKTPIVDCHVHCFAGKDDAKFPYHPRGTYQPPIASTPQQLIAGMDGAGIDYSIVVHPEPYQDDHRYLRYCLEVGGKRLKGTCLFFAVDEDSPARMKTLAGQCDLVAARIHAHLDDRLPPFGKPELRTLWRSASDLGLAVQLHFRPKYAAGFEPLIEEFTQTPVIIDHLGRMPEGTAAERERILKWSRYKNTIIKLSSFPAVPPAGEEDLGPIVKRTTDAFGPERMIYGGAFGEAATPASMKAHVARARELLAHLPAAEQSKILGGNAVQLFRLNR